MKQIRKGVFETNSSSTHSITICTQEEFDKFMNGELVYDSWEDKLVPVDSQENDAKRYSTWNNLGDGGFSYLETYAESFTTPSGDHMVAFGSYGYDG